MTELGREIPLLNWPCETTARRMHFGAEHHSSTPSGPGEDTFKGGGRGGSGGADIFRSLLSLDFLVVQWL